MRDAILLPVDHLRLLVQFHLDSTPGGEPFDDPQDLLAMLWEANRQAVAHRCGAGVLHSTDPQVPEFTLPVWATYPIPVLKALEGFEDQVFDLPDYAQTPTGRWCRQLRRRALSGIEEGWAFPDESWIFEPV